MTGYNRKLAVLAVAGLFISANGIADTGAQSSGGTDNIADHLDEKGDRIDKHLDHKGDRIDARFDRKAEIAADKGNEKRAAYLDTKGDHLDRHLDKKGDRIDHRLDRKAHQLDTNKIHQGSQPHRRRSSQEAG
jgi:hypothetical protein